MKSLVIFDLDGTLLNTIDDLGEAANYALSQCGYPIHSISSYPLYVGNGVTKLLERVLPKEARTSENIETLRKHFIEYYNQHDSVNTTPYQGIPEVLKVLSQRGIKLAVASNKYHEAVERLIKHYFPNENWVAIEGHKNGYPVKPNPSIVFDILLKSPTPKREILYVGDSGVDMETARRACVDSVGVTWGFRSVGELRDHYANHIINHPGEILNLI
ncbi:MAG: HAD family hydrolase [Bacteroidales bacterium]|nr:HAD family hydrolase [Bacteroidales bacterium]